MTKTSKGGYNLAMSFIFGKEIGQNLRNTLKTEISAKGLAPTLAVLLVGSDPASATYVALKLKAAEEVGIQLILEHRPTLSTEEALGIVSTWNQDPNVHGILVQLPLPAGLDTDAIIQAIVPEKDVDSFHPANREALLKGDARFFSPVHLAVLTLIGQTPLSLIGAQTLVLAKSEIFSEPLVHLLRKAGASVNVAMSVPPVDVLKKYALVITALGQPGLLSGGMFADDVVIIDISTTRLPDGKIVGDVAADTVKETQCVSPVPGGVGPLTIAFLLKNVVDAAANSRN